MEIHLKIIGFLLMILALIHAIFPSYFNWKEELAHLSLINKQLMYVHTFFIALVVFLFGVLSFFAASDLINTALGRYISLGFAIFWGIRLFFQFFVYSSELWKGKLFETIAHILFSLLWLYLIVIYTMVYYKN